MPKRRKPITILMADDDPDDRLLTQRAFERSGLGSNMQFVEDGEELMDYLKRRGKYHSPAASPRPGLILLDLNMPRMQGHEALREIKADPHLRPIPVVVLTTSRAQEDIFRTYDLGANSFISKPATFDGMLAMIKSLIEYWFKFVELQSESSAV